MEQALNHLIDVLDNNFSLISMVIGAMLGFFSQLYLNKINQKNEITKELSKEYIRTKMDVLGKAVELFQEYELKMKTEMPTYYYDDIWDICVEENNEEIIYWCYFLKVIEYLNKNRFYLDEETIKKLDVIKIKYYYDYKLELNYVINEFSPDDMHEGVLKLQKKLYNKSKKEFEELNKQIIKECERHIKKLEHIS